MAEKTKKSLFLRIIALIVAIALLALLFFVFLLMRTMSRPQAPNTNLVPQERSQFDLSQRNLAYYDTVFDKQSPSTGAENASIVIVEYSDFRCPYCQQFFPSIRRISQEYPNDVRVIYRDFPLIGEDSRTLALAAHCAGEQGKYLPLHDKMYLMGQQVTTENLLDIAQTVGINAPALESCVNSQRHNERIDHDIADAQAAGVTSTPTIFINGHRLSGAVPYDILKKVVETTLQSVN